MSIVHRDSESTKQTLYWAPLWQPIATCRVEHGAISPVSMYMDLPVFLRTNTGKILKILKN